MKILSLGLWLVLSASIFFTGCKKESVPPTDEEILGGVVKPENIDEYIYPIRPGMPEWAELKSHDEMLAVLELPDSVLENISTWGLAETCLDYPLAGDCFAHNDQVAYINDLNQSFNGLKELFSRKDVSEVLLYTYRYLDFSLYPVSFDRFYIELITGSDSFLSNLDRRQLQYLASVALEKADYQSEHFDSSFPPYSYYIMANAMIHYGYKPFIDYCANNKEVNSTGYFLWRINSSVEKIRTYAEAFVNN